MNLSPHPPAALRPPPDVQPLPAWSPRSAAWGWAATAVVVIVGLPLFLRMPLWVDVTLYDVAARTILDGGTHYRDVFDTNPPGFVWCLCLLRPLVGPSSEALRAVDVLIVAAVAALLLAWARRAGASRAGVAWAGACVASFYLFASEFNHCQRDVWMMVPALSAAAYRFRRARRVAVGGEAAGWVFGSAVCEGMVWGLAVWIKPHVILVAGACWACTLAPIGAGPGRWRRWAADLGGVVLGGLLVGAAGLAWLVGSGTWPYFDDVFNKWNTAYIWRVLVRAPSRVGLQLEYFPPWSLLFVLAVPLAVANVIDARLWTARPSAGGPGPVGRRLPRWLYDPLADVDARYRRGCLAAVYLAWATVALGLQNEFHYVHVPETLLMLALFAANRWRVAVLALAAQWLVIGWVAVEGGGVKPWVGWSREARAFIWPYPYRDPNRLRWWAGSFAREVPGELRNGVAFQSDHFGGVDWVEFPEVVEFLRSQGVKPGDSTVICWNDATHPLYLAMHLRPGIRFMHMSTACEFGEKQREWVQNEVVAAAPHVRFVVTDLVRVTFTYPPPLRPRTGEPGPGPDLLPPVVPAEARDVFPLNQPTVFRTRGGRGRYIVHVLTNPVGTVDVPRWPWE